MPTAPPPRRNRPNTGRHWADGPLGILSIAASLMLAAALALGAEVSPESPAPPVPEVSQDGPPSTSPETPAPPDVPTSLPIDLGEYEGY